jgi:hypothetical protein
MKQALAGDLRLLRARFEGRGLNPELVEPLRTVRWVEVDGYPPVLDKDSRRDRARIRSAVSATTNCDLLILVVDGRKSLQPADLTFAQAWDRHFIEHPQQEAPPTLVVITGVDMPDFGVVWAPPYDWSTGKGVREAAVRGLFESLRATLPPTFADYTAAGLADQTPFGVAEHVLPALAAQFHRAERSALIRHLQSLSGRSRVGRVLTQLGQHGRQVWTNLRTRHKSVSQKS